MKKETLYIFGTYVFLITIFAMAWFSDSTIYRPLITDLTKVNSVAVVDILEKNTISYQVNPQNSILFVATEDYANALTALKSVMPKEKDKKLSMAYEILLNEPIKLYEESWFIQLYKLFGCLLISVISIVAIIRPMVILPLLTEVKNRS